MHDHNHDHNDHISELKGMTTGLNRFAAVVLLPQYLIIILILIHVSIHFFDVSIE